MGTVRHRAALQKRKMELQEIASRKNYSYLGSGRGSFVLDFLVGSGYDNPTISGLWKIL